jgi:hypothetical protein
MFRSNRANGPISEIARERTFRTSEIGSKDRTFAGVSSGLLLRKGVFNEFVSSSAIWLCLVA